MEIIISYPETGNPVKQSVFQRLQARPEVDLDVVPPGEPVELDGADLYHMAKRTDETLELLGEAEDHGIPTVNSYAGAATLNDRLAAKQYLGNRGFSLKENVENPYREEDLPLIQKTRFETARGAHDHGILEEPGEGDDGRFTEPFLDGEVVKAYCAAGEVRAEDSSGKETKLEPDDAETVESVGEHLELSLYEVDLLEANETYVLDVNSAVSMRNIADAEDLYISAIEESLDKTLPII